MTLEMEATNISTKIQSTISSVLHAVEKAMANGITLNEAVTESIAIDPILEALGYLKWEYQKHGMADSVGIIPDYTILPQNVIDIEVSNDSQDVLDGKKGLKQKAKSLVFPIEEAHHLPLSHQQENGEDLR